MKNILILFLFVGITIQTFSQKFEGGLMGGLSASQVDGDTYSGYHKPGIVAGAYVQTDLSRFVFSGMELKFVQKGSRKKLDPKQSSDQAKYIMRLNYIDLPVYLGVRTSENISILAGLSSGFLLKGTEFDNYGKFVEADEKPFNSFDLQAMIGFRYQLNNRIYIDLRGAYSLLPIRAKPGDVLWYWKDSQFSNILSTTIFYRLDF